MQFSYEARTEQDTERLAKSLRPYLIPGTVIALDGDLGAGKTRFSQAVARAMEIRANVNSPTFTIIKEYEAGSLPLYHMDVYRISVEEAEELGLDDYFFGDGVTLVEWASRIPDLLPEERLDIYIETTGEQSRRFRLSPRGEAFQRLCLELKEIGILL